LDRIDAGRQNRRSPPSRFDDCAGDHDGVRRKALSGRRRAILRNGSDEKRYTLWNLICQNDSEHFPDLHERIPFASVWWTDGEKNCGGEQTQGIVDIRGYAYNPILCPRWDVVESIYATGPGRIGLPDVLELYRLEKDSLKGIAQRVDPPLAVPEGLSGEVSTFPGARTYYPEGAMRDRAVHNLLETAPDVGRSQNKIQQVEARLRRVVLRRPFQRDPEHGQHTRRADDGQAGRGNERRKNQPSRASLTNLNHGLFDPLIEGVFGVMLEEGLVPEPPEDMGGIEFQPEYVSTLHMRQQEEARLGGIIRFNQFAAGVIQINPGSALKINFDQMLDEASTALAVPGSVIRSDKEVQKMRDQIALEKQQAQQAAAAAEMGRQIPGYADAAKKLSETTAGGTNALESLLGANRQTSGGLL
jgi:hypothetical protein